MQLSHKSFVVHCDLCFILTSAPAMAHVYNVWAVSRFRCADLLSARAVSSVPVRRAICNFQVEMCIYTVHIL